MKFCRSCLDLTADLWTGHGYLVILWLAQLLLIKSTSSTVIIEVGDICQGTSNGLTAVDDTPENRISALKNKYKNCKYVDGNLEITGLDHQDFYDKDLSFLNSIREVTGYVLIANVYVQNVTLENLTIIRGDSLFYPPGVSKTASSNSSSTPAPQPGYALFVSLNYMSTSDAIGMRLLGLRNLTEISAGDVLFENNKLLCYATTDIYWLDILADGTRRQHVRLNNDIVSINAQPCRPGCHESCFMPIPDAMARYCWGPGPKNCQKMNKVTCAKQCDGGRCFGPESNKCCHAQCAGGCDGPSKTDCWGCKNFYNDGGCEPFCPQQQLYDNAKYQWIPNPDRKFAFGKLCTEKCPLQFLEYKGECVTSCPQGFEAKDGSSSCIECTGPCAKRCSVNWRPETDFLNDKNIDELEGCTSLDGHLRILDVSFAGDPPFDIPPMPVEKLEKLRSIKEITEYLQIQSLTSENITTLGFLSNLQKIWGRQTDSLGASLSIMNNNHLEYLELTSLRSISSGLVIVRHNPRLCFLETLNWGTIAWTTVAVSENANETQCRAMSLTCDRECKDGCWGPGNTRCVSCKNSRYGDHCLSDCRGSLLYNIAGERECHDCDSECKSACTGPGSALCDECMNFRDGPYNCVAECPKEVKYPDVNGTCQQCHSHCIDGCTGPGNFVGDGGCNSCEVSIANDDETAILRCLDKEEPCPSGYFPNSNSRGKLAFLKDMKVCTRCDPLCAECEDKGNFHCPKCTHYQRGAMCVEECEKGYYTDHLSRQCHLCHDTCMRDCTGPTEWDCEHCLHYKVYNSSRPSLHLENIVIYNQTSSTIILDGTNNTLKELHQTTESQIKHYYCTEELVCPPGLPHTEQEERDSVCTSRTVSTPYNDNQQTALPARIIAAVVVAILVLIVILGVVGALMCLRRARKQEQKLKWTQILSGGAGLEPVDPSTAAPDMSKLRLIKEIELRRGGILGSGAFGTVYKGVWLPEGENKKIPVAIKVLQEGNSPRQNQELLEEARVMASVEHPCCVRIVAVCLTEQMMLITQLMPLGCLLDYVKNNKPKISSKVMLDWCTQIAKGMTYLEGKGVVHRDLAARNVLVQHPNQVKITDFGLAKLLDFNEGEYHSAGGKMPIKWLALESIQHRKFTHKTDVWSYGVTLWEMFMYGQKPYENNRAWEVPELLEKGERLPQPTICTIDVYMIMIKCWMIDAESRPSFTELASEFAKMSRDPGRYLAIEGDSLMRLPSSSMDAREMLATSSELSDGPEEIMDADDYLNMAALRSMNSTADVTEEEATAAILDVDVVSYNHRMDSLPHRVPRSQPSSLHMTYPRQHFAVSAPPRRHDTTGATYVNGFLSHERNAAGDSPYRGSLSTLESRRDGQQHGSNSALRGIGQSASVNSLKPYKCTSDSLLCIEEINQDNAEPPDYFSSSSNTETAPQRSAPPIYVDGYFHPRSAHSLYASQRPELQAPSTPTAASLPEESQPRVFTFDIMDDKPRIFANPEYFDSGNMAASNGQHENEEDEESDLSNPLLPQHTKDYYNSLAAFGSDSSARDSFISTEYG